MQAPIILDLQRVVLIRQCPGQDGDCGGSLFSSLHVSSSDYIGEDQDVSSKDCFC